MAAHLATLTFIPSLLPTSSNSNSTLPHFTIQTRGFRRRRIKFGGSLIVTASSTNEKCTKFVTFLGKGGSGKTTAAVFAAQHYSKSGLNTCLVTHSQDFTAESLLNCKIGKVLVALSDNLSVIRLETTKMIVEPLKQLKKADARVNMTQNTLEGIVGEELGVLPGMDSIFSAFGVEKFVGFLGVKGFENQYKDKFDVVIYDGISTVETLRMMSAANSTRLYIKHLRSLAENTDIGRLAGPSLLRLVDEATSLNNSSSSLNGRFSTEIWDSLERLLEKGSSAFANPETFKCYILADPCNPVSMKTAMRYWGCTIQAGSHISGVFGVNSRQSSMESIEDIKRSFSPLPFALVPNIPYHNHTNLDWDEIISNAQCENAISLLHMAKEKTKNVIPSVKFDPVNRCVTLFMPGFEKSEIKLYQFRGGSELLVEAGDQRRIIKIPREMQGKVGGAKFTDRNLVITLK